MGIIQDVNDRLRKAFRGGDMTRNKRREIERELRKRGANDEQIAYALMLEDNRDKANEIYNSMLKLLVKLGYDVFPKVTWHDTGANTQIILAPMDIATHQRVMAYYKAQEEAVDKKAEVDQAAAEGEDATIEKITDARTCGCKGIEHQVCDECQGGNANGKDAEVQVANPCEGCKTEAKSETI